MYSLKALQLYAVTLAENIKAERCYPIFSEFIDTMNILSGEGLVLRVNGVEKRYSGFLAFCLGDTPALNWLGGFKESVSKTIRFCRTCEVEKSLKKGVRKQLGDISHIPLRNLKNHKDILQKMAKNHENKEEISKKTGINSDSILLEINDFDICQCLLQDPMHILYEGICHVELSCLLNNIIATEEIVDLNYLNKQIKKFKYLSIDKTDLPAEIADKYFKKKDSEAAYKKFNQTSGQMSTLYQYLPLMIGSNDKLTGNKNWQNFLRLVNVH
jgi:hypothetical protein